MAKVDLYRSQRNGSFLFYNLDAAVGKGGANRRDDVLLVQYLMKTSANVPGKFTAQVSGAAQVAGVWSEFDDLLLGTVQRNWSQRGTATWQDRRVDPVPFQRSVSPIHHAQYKILTLNVIYKYLRPSDFPRMAETADCPGELKPLIGAPDWLKSTL
jgi:hypothetical protein